ncbi:MAG: FHA domain-containing protein [Lentisphaeria bacterium]|nr:FHA domain-containing protein [Lentisphaeria bacterium]
MQGNPKLIILSEPLRGQSFELVDDVYSIGRSDQMDICIVDPTVSGHHCDLRKNEDGSYNAFDEEISTNGSRVNGEIVTNQKLIRGDILQVGSVECMYDSEDDSVNSSVMSTRTQIHIDEESLIKTNTRTNLAPGKFNPNSQQSKLMRNMTNVVIILLVVVVVLLLIFVLIQVLSGEAT